MVTNGFHFLLSDMFSLSIYTTILLIFIFKRFCHDCKKKYDIIAFAFKLINFGKVNLRKDNIKNNNLYDFYNQINIFFGKQIAQRNIE